MPYQKPTAIIELPSKGLIYPDSHPLHVGKIEMVMGGAEQENIMANESYQDQNIVIDKLLQSMIVSPKFNYDDLITGDKDMILMSARTLMFGKNYEFNYLLPGDKDLTKITFDLTTLKSKKIDESKFIGVNEFEYVMPNSGVKITYKHLTHGDEKKIEEEIVAMKEISDSLDKSSSVRWYYQIVAVDGNRATSEIRDYVNNGLISLDSYPCREYIQENSPGVDLTFNYTDPKTKREYKDLPLPLTRNFFRYSRSVQKGTV